MTRIKTALLRLLELVLAAVDKLTGGAITRGIAGGAETAYTDEHGTPIDPAANTSDHPHA